MCAPSTPTPAAAPVQEPIATPTYADAGVQKAGANQRGQQASRANRNIRSSQLGVTEEATTQKKTLLGE